MPPSGETEVLRAVTGIHSSMNRGFAEIHKKIEDKFEDCDERLKSVETTLAIKKALCKKRKEDEATTKDFWKPVIRGVTVAGAIALAVIAAKLVIFGISLKW